MSLHCEQLEPRTLLTSVTVPRAPLPAQVDRPDLPDGTPPEVIDVIHEIQDNAISVGGGGNLLAQVWGNADEIARDLCGGGGIERGLGGLCGSSIQAQEELLPMDDIRAIPFMDVGIVCLRESVGAIRCHNALRVRYVDSQVQFTAWFDNGYLGGRDHYFTDDDLGDWGNFVMTVADNDQLQREPPEFEPYVPPPDEVFKSLTLGGLAL